MPNKSKNAAMDALRADCVEFILADGRRFAWSDSNVRYEEVPPDGESFTMLRKRLTEMQELVKDWYTLSHMDTDHPEVEEELLALRRQTEGRVPGISRVVT